MGWRKYGQETLEVGIGCDEPDVRADLDGFIKAENPAVVFAVS